MFNKNPGSCILTSAHTGVCLCFVAFLLSFPFFVLGLPFGINSPNQFTFKGFQFVLFSCFNRGSESKKKTKLKSVTLVSQSLLLPQRSNAKVLMACLFSFFLFWFLPSDFQKNRAGFESARRFFLCFVCIPMTISKPASQQASSWRSRPPTSYSV